MKKNNVRSAITDDHCSVPTRRQSFKCPGWLETDGTYTQAMPHDSGMVQFASLGDDGRNACIRLLGPVVNVRNRPTFLVEQIEDGDLVHRLYWDDGRSTDFGQLNGTFVENLRRADHVLVYWRPLISNQKFESLFIVNYERVKP